MSTDIEIARAAKLRPIQSIADRLAIPSEALSPHGRHIGKIDLDWLGAQPERPASRLVLVTAINPTPAGEGKTTTTVGLGDGLNRIGKSTMICLREPRSALLRREGRAGRAAMPRSCPWSRSTCTSRRFPRHHLAHNCSRH